MSWFDILVIVVVGVATLSVIGVTLYKKFTHKSTGCGCGCDCSSCSGCSNKK